jgi:RNA polymerase sigma factor (TIGR02999 family)
MAEITRLLWAAESGDPAATAELLPLVYEELRQLAAVRLSSEAPGQTLQPTALVHEAYLRLLGPAGANICWDHRGHFFAAAAEAMRRILIENARRKQRLKRGGGLRRAQEDMNEIAAPESENGQLDLLALDEAIEELGQHDPAVASFVKLRYFAGLTHEQAAKALDVSPRVADRYWSLARAWLFRRLEGDE